MPSSYYPLHYVNDLAVDPKGNLYILLNESSQMVIYVYSKEGDFIGKLIGVNDDISRIVINHNMLYALGKETHHIYKFELIYE